MNEQGQTLSQNRYPKPCNKCLYNWANSSVRDFYCQREEKRPQDPMQCKKFKRDNHSKHE